MQMLLNTELLPGLSKSESQIAGGWRNTLGM